DSPAVPDPAVPDPGGPGGAAAGHHLPEEVLAALALDGARAAPTSAARDHLGGCVRCRAELTDLRGIVSAVRGAGAAEADVVAPPPGVWDAIAAEVEAEVRAPGPRDGTIDPLAPVPPDPAASADPTASRGESPELPESPEGTAGGRPVVPAEEGTAGPGAPTAAVPAARSGPDGDDPRPTSPVAIPGPRRRPVMFAVAASLMVGILIGSAGTWWQMSRDTAPIATPSAGYTAEYVRIDPPEGVDLPAVGRVRLDGGEETGHALVISVRGLPETSGYFEVWLMDEGAGKLIPIGVLDGEGTAVLPLPHNVDLGEYALVDVSEEPFNGSPDHSGKSIVRGPLRA
ncbi:anti-sigma factor, partial [Streptomyces calidiresistens]